MSHCACAIAIGGNGKSVNVVNKRSVCRITWEACEVQSHDDTCAVGRHGDDYISSDVGPGKIVKGMSWQSRLVGDARGVLLDAGITKKSLLSLSANSTRLKDNATYCEAWVGWTIIGNGTFDGLDTSESSTWCCCWNDRKDTRLCRGQKDWCWRNLCGDEGKRARKSKEGLHLQGIGCCAV